MKQSKPFALGIPLLAVLIVAIGYIALDYSKQQDCLNSGGHMAKTGLTADIAGEKVPVEKCAP